MKRVLLYVISVLILPLSGGVRGGLYAQSYYSAIDGKSGAELKAVLKDIIANHKKLYYGSLWSYYESTDFIEGKKNTAAHYQVFDYYNSTIHYFNGDGTTVSGMDREHAVPQSWWGNDDTKDIRSDLFHVMPAESKANSAKSNYPLGKVTGKTSYSNPRMKTGKDSRNEMVFEPADNYKGDFARIYFYIATCYTDIWQTGTNYAMQAEDYPTLKSWIVPLLLEWNQLDPVDEWELKRQERVQRFQQNRNPFIDYPQLADYIWGTQSEEAFNLDEQPLQSINTDTYQYGNIFFSTLIGDKADFTVKNVKGTYTVWKMDNQYGWKASGYVSGSARATESWLISPAIQLPTDYAVLCFDHALNYDTSEAVSVHISTDKQNWTELTVPTWPAGTNWNFLFSGDIDLSEWLGQTVYIAFRYTSTTSKAATWEIQNFNIFGGGQLVPTAIEGPSTKDQGQSIKDQVQGTKAIYNLNGQRITTPQPGHIYIIEGRKVLY